MTNGCDSPLVRALQHMQAAIDLLDASGEAPIGTAEHLDLAIHNLAASLEASGLAPVGRPLRTIDLGEGLQDSQR